MSAASVVLLARGGQDRALSWARHGLATVAVVPLAGGWTGVCPVSDRAVAGPPFDDPVAAVLARPMPRRMLPTIGIAVIGARLAVACVPAVLRPRPRWLVWEPGTGTVRPGPLTPGSVGTLAAAAGARQARDMATSILRDGRGDATRVAADLFTALRLPGLELFLGADDPLAAPGAVLVEPAREDVARFERTAHEVRRWREEVEGSR
ncbi:MAG: hypothetical protein IPL45_08200 [Actinomycetales bacterium]|nr:hypothetical protein [Actinomycetales bacterium]